MMKVFISAFLACLIAAFGVDTSHYNHLNDNRFKFDKNFAVAAVFTPFSNNGSLDVSQVEEHAKLLQKQGVKWAFVAGTTGESVKLTYEERLTLAQTWTDLRDQYGVKVIMHIGDESVETSRNLARHMAKIGVDAVGAMPPTFFKPPKVENVIKTIQYVAKECPELPFFYYHIPMKTGVDFMITDILTMIYNGGNPIIPNFAGVKFTDANLMDFKQAVQIGGGFYTMLYGKDEQLLEGLVAGAVGSVGTTVNWNGELFNALIEAHNAGDMASASLIQADITSNVWETLSAGGPCIVEGLGCEADMHKATLTASTKVDFGPPRLPQLQATQDTIDNLADRAKNWCQNLQNAKVIPFWCSLM